MSLIELLISIVLLIVFVGMIAWRMWLKRRERQEADAELQRGKPGEERKEAQRGKPGEEGP